MLCTSAELKYFTKKGKEIIWLEVCLVAFFFFSESWPYCFFGSWPKKFCFIDLCVGCWDINSLNCQQWNCSGKYEAYICSIWFRCGKGGGGGGAEEVRVLTRAYCLLPSFYPMPVSESRETELLMQGSSANH